MLPTAEAQRPDLMDPEALHETIAYLTACEAHLREPEASPAPDPEPLRKHAAYGCISSVTLDTEDGGETYFAVSINGQEPYGLDPSDYLCLRVGTAFGLHIPDILLGHGMERSAFRQAALSAFDQNTGVYPIAVTREQYAHMLDLAFGLADRIQGSDVEGLFPVTILAGADAQAAEVNL